MEKKKKNREIEEFQKFKFPSPNPSAPTRFSDNKTKILCISLNSTIWSSIIVWTDMVCVDIIIQVGPVGSLYVELTVKCNIINSNIAYGIISFGRHKWRWGGKRREFSKSNASTSFIGLVKADQKKRKKVILTSNASNIRYRLSSSCRFLSIGGYLLPSTPQDHSLHHNSFHPARHSVPPTENSYHVFNTSQALKVS